nr:FAD:protein FMN transferase [Bifidobacterium samirii]
MPHAAAFPRALGTGIIIRSSRAIDAGTRETIGGFIGEYERVLSRFRADSTVAAMAAAEHGGTFDFPDWANGLFDLADMLADATDGAVDPCAGEDLIRLGYGADYTFTLAADADGRLGAIHGRPTWRGDMTRRGATLTTTRPVRLDFGAYGKGYLVDLIAGMLDARHPEHADGHESDPTPENGDNPTSGKRPTGTSAEDSAQSGIMSHLAAHAASTTIPAAAPYSGCSPECSGEPSVKSGRDDHDAADRLCDFIIDAGGDLRIRSATPVVIGLEDPADTSRAVGTAAIGDGSFCASAPSRRHWRAAAAFEAHHLINAIDGLPVRDVAATWVSVAADTRPSAAFADHPTALADGLATALFVTPADMLTDRFPGRFDCALLHPDRTALVSRGFPGRLFRR